MKKILLPLAIVAALLLHSCKTDTDKGSATATVIGPKTITPTSDRMTPELLWSMGRLGEVECSPDGQTLLFSITYYDVAENKGNSELYTM